MSANIFENSDAKARQIWEIIKKYDMKEGDEKRLCKLLSDFRTETIKEVQLRTEITLGSLKSQSLDYWQITI